MTGTPLQSLLPHHHLLRTLKNRRIMKPRRGRFYKYFIGRLKRTFADSNLVQEVSDKVDNPKQRAETAADFLQKFKIWMHEAGYSNKVMETFLITRLWRNVHVDTIDRIIFSDNVPMTLKAWKERIIIQDTLQRERQAVLWIFFPFVYLIFLFPFFSFTSFLIRCYTLAQFLFSITFLITLRTHTLFS